MSQSIPIRSYFANRRLGGGITRRCLKRLEVHLSKPKERSPFTVVRKSASKALAENDTRHLDGGIVQTIKEIFSDTYDAFDRMIDKTIEDPKEAKARLDLKSHIDVIQRDFDAACQDLERVKAKYAEPVIKIEA